MRRGFSTQLPGSLILPAAPPSRRSCRCYRGSLPSLAPRSRLHDRLVIAALPRPAASLGAALGRGPDFCGSYLVCLLALAVPAGWIPPYDDGLASGLAFLVRASALTRNQVLVIRAKSAWSGLQSAVRSSTLARLVNGDRAVTVCERSLGCMGILTWETGYALPAARAKIQLG